MSNKYIVLCALLTISRINGAAYEKPVNQLRPQKPAQQQQDLSQQRAQGRLNRILGHVQKPRPSIEPNPVSASGMMARGQNLKNILEQSSKMAERDFLAWRDFLLGHQDMLQKIFEHEEFYGKDYYVFYHAHAAAYRLISYICGLIFQNIIAHKPLPGDFVLLRSEIDRRPYDQQLHGRPYETVQEYLASFDIFGKGWDFNQKSLILDDDKPEIAKDILSTNATLFGNYQEDGECTWDYFLKNTSASHAYIEETLQSIFKHYKFDQTIIPQLLSLIDALGKQPINYS